MRRETSQAARTVAAFPLTACCRPGLFEVPEHHGEHSVQSFKVLVRSRQGGAPQDCSQDSVHSDWRQSTGQACVLHSCRGSAVTTCFGIVSRLAMVRHVCMHIRTSGSELSSFSLISPVQGTPSPISSGTVLPCRPCSRCHAKLACQCLAKDQARILQR